MAQNDEFCMFFRQPENVLFQSTPPALRWARMPTLQINLRFDGGLKRSSTNEVKLKPTLLHFPNHFFNKGNFFII